MEIGEPTVLAKLPRAGLTGDGQTKFCQVYGIRNQQRKKRHEICAAVDGNSLNVFEVVNGRNIASWPVPPDVAFVSKPYSERVHTSKDSFVRRSWCAVQRRGKTSVQYYEQTRKGSDTAVSTKSHFLKSQAAILSIEPANTIEREVLAVQEDGHLTAFSADGDAVRYACSLRDPQHAVKFLALQSMSKVGAQFSVLKSRQDLAATLPDEALCLAAVYQNRDTKDLYLGIWAFAPTTAAADSNTPLEPLLRHVLDQQKSGSLKKATVEFTSSNKKLDITTSTLVRTLDITTAVPQKLSDRKHLVSDSLSHLDLHPEITLYLTSDKLQAYNKNFGALQASSRLNVSTLKRKRDGEEAQRITLIAYFSQIKRVLASGGNQLLVFDLHVRDGSQNPFRQGSLLIGNILRGNDKHEQTDRSVPQFTCSIGTIEHERQIKDWPIISKDLDQLAEQKDAKGFEERFKSAFNLQRPKDLNSSKMPGSKQNYLLSKIFASTATDSEAVSQPIKVGLLLPDLLRWCISGGLLEGCRLASALQLDPAGIDSLAVARALLEVGSQHELVEHYVQQSPFLPPEVLTFIARSLVNEALQQSESEATKLLQDGTEMETDDAAPTQQLVLGSRPEMSASTPTTTCLAHTLKRLAFAGPVIVSEQLRSSSFGQREILAMIQFLRQQLFLGGYSRLGEMRNYPSPPPSNAGDEGDNDLVFHRQLSLQGIVTLLNGCIDALGPIGILGSAEEGAFIEKMVPELLSEVASASQAVEDSSFLQGILRETLRYAESVERQPFEVRSKVENKDGNSEGKGRIVTLYSEPETTETGALSGSALPLSLKAEEDIDKFKVRKGGQSYHRSAREIGMLKDRLKSPYSFERLVL
ncbi:hypothetical protein PMZ80_008561 [Knufia obscura]|uniref:Uncharacterized protein n=1 Tax=Knufia obscura TaxID=1635080 RepID=A0ABR0RG78_9EURO|nr:hypothetical protein PMZ80_008561 [Knufia obscura]